MSEQNHTETRLEQDMEQTDCTHDCSSCGADCGSRSDPADLRVAKNPMSDVRHVIGVVSGKGGVGKSLVSSLLAVAMQRSGRHVGVMDADITGPSIPKMFGVHTKAEGSDYGLFPVRTQTGIDIMSINLLLEDETDPVVWRGPVIAGLIQQFWSDVVWSKVDTLFIDMPPGTGDVPLTVFQSLPVDGIVVVTTPQDLVGDIVTKAVKMAKMMDIPILGVVENMAYLECPDCGKRLYPFGEGRSEEVARSHGLEVIGRIPIDRRLAKACDEGMIEFIDEHPLMETAKKLEELFPVHE